MGKVRFFLALICSKITYMGLKLFKRKASHLPGVIATKICPNYLNEARRFKKIICITGTNGKTTTTNMIADILIDNGYSLNTNRQGANINTGVATVITNSLNIFGKPKVDMLVLEVDERFSRLIFPSIKPDYLVVTNLFRDSLKRNAHPEYIFGILDKYTPKETKVILNADDIFSSQLLKENNRTYFGIDKLDTDIKECINLVSDYTTCQNCGEKLVYNYLRYHHIGNAYCPKCGFKSETSDYNLNKLDFENNVLTITHNGSNYTFPVINTAIYNTYNELAAITFCMEFGIEYNKIKESLEKTKIVNTRFGENKVGKFEFIQTMAKGQNSVSCSRTLEYVANEPGDKSIIIAIDDFLERKDSSEFIGWIYDADFEFLKKDNIKQIILAGPRCYDYEVRLLLAGIEKEKIISGTNEFEMVEKINTNIVDTVYLLFDTSTYDLSCELKEKIIKILEEVK